MDPFDNTVNRLSEDIVDLAEEIKLEAAYIAKMSREQLAVWFEEIIATSADALGGVPCR